MRTWACAAVCFCACVGSAFGWGDYGHEQVNGAAVQLLLGRNRGLAQFLAPNSALLRRLSITPDADWKSSLQQEPPLHFFEVDAFVAAEQDPGAIMLLPTGDYLDVYPQYRQLLSANADYVSRMSPGKPMDPAAHGTAPWRVLQLYDLAVSAMRRHDPAQALFFLGVMGHYVADLSQPLHTTVDFDAAHSAQPAAGIHSAFEAQMLEREALRKAGVLDKAVLAAAAAALGGKRLAAVPRGKVVYELFALVRGGYPLIPPLLQAFARQCAAAGELAPPEESAAYCAARSDAAGRPQPPLVPDLVVSAFSTSAMSVRTGRTAYETTVLKAAEDRLGKAAALLARLWVSAYEAGGSPNFGPIVVRFEDLRVNDSYPVPDYLPASAPEARSARSAGAVETITPVAVLLGDKRRYDNKLLCAKGVTSVLFRKTSRKGNDYFTFWISEGGAKVKVHSFGHPDFSEGEEVEACGRFTIEKHLSGRVFYDELSAQSILKGPAIQAGYVELTPAGVLRVKH
ncbi:MAG: hypothetical protein NTY77_06780 [Elusimicrobia bacterium]|nr:hypothetical protein [Elusimicrobiota bacterium]